MQFFAFNLNQTNLKKEPLVLFQILSEISEGLSDNTLPVIATTAREFP